MRVTASRTSSTASCVGFSSRNSTVTVTVPASTPAGLYYLLGCADDGDDDRDQHHILAR